MKEGYSILIPTDFSETADHALEIGLKLAQRNNSETQILHTENMLKHWAEIAENSKENLYRDIKEQINKARAGLDDRIEMAKKEGVTKVDSFLEYDRNHKGILSHAEDHQNDLIVMGARGLTGLKGFLIGSCTQKIISHSDVPVLAINQSNRENDLRHLVFLSDYDPDYADSISNVVEFARQMNIKISFLCINTRLNFRETDETDANMKEYTSRVPEELIESVDVINVTMVEEGLEKYCEQRGIDLIAVTNYTKPHFAGVLGTTVENLINRSELPVLTIPVMH